MKAAIVARVGPCRLLGQPFVPHLVDQCGGLRGIDLAGIVDPFGDGFFDLVPRPEPGYEVWADERP
ncbi:Uncharacterised protein [Mycobacteroides abscessus subsp. massiliense]|nr:Uncharacterised protein [Mycobacteroides abscessus subsp. massiliense]